MWPIKAEEEEEILMLGLNKTGVNLVKYYVFMFQFQYSHFIDALWYPPVFSSYRLFFI